MYNIIYILYRYAYLPIMIYLIYVCEFGLDFSDSYKIAYYAHNITMHAVVAMWWHVVAIIMACVSNFPFSL